jgi:hypothetical protein
VPNRADTCHTAGASSGLPEQAVAGHQAGASSGNPEAVQETTAAAHVQPATALPWELVVSERTIRGGETYLLNVCGSITNAEVLADAEYSVHAANAYPKLVAALMRAADGCAEFIPTQDEANEAYALLRELGEL